MHGPVQRRLVLAGLAASAVVPRIAAADQVIDLEWKDLLPKHANGLPDALNGVIDHSSTSLISQQPVSTGVRTDWSGQTVRLPGFIIPIDFDSTGVASFILVPYVGACIHVPPPPANQLVLVTSETPYEGSTLFEAVNVTGVFGVSSNATELADIGYTIVADNIEARF